MAEKIATFQERFNELLESTPKSRSTIAEEFGVAKQTISARATGQSSPRTPVVSSLAEYFDVNIEWLVGYDVPMRPDRSLNLQLFTEGKPPDPKPANDNVRLLINGANKMDPEDVKDITDWIRFWYTKKYPNLFDEKGTEDNANT